MNSIENTPRNTAQNPAFQKTVMHETFTGSRLLPFLCLTLAALFALPVAAAPPTPVEAATPPPSAERHESGLVSLVLTPGTGTESPDTNDIVQAHYTGWTREGEEFVSSYKAGQPATFNLATVFPGWREGLSQMVVGEVRRLWVPEHLGPQNAKSGPSSAVFDVELLEIRPLPDAPQPLREPRVGALRAASGAHYVVVEEGEGESPDSASRVLVEWSLWHESGKMVNSTAVRGRPTAFLLDRVFPAFSQLVQDMEVGERRIVWMPDTVHGGQWPQAPKQGMLIFDMQLLEILPDSALQLDG